MAKAWAISMGMKIFWPGSTTSSHPKPPTRFGYTPRAIGSSGSLNNNQCIAGDWPMDFWSASRYLYLISQLPQNISNLLALFTLNLDHAVFDRPACAAFLFQLFRQRFQVTGGMHQVFHQCHCLPAASTG